MFWKKIAKATQVLAFTIAVAGIFVAAIALASGESIPIPSIPVALKGCVVGLLGLVWEDFLDWLDRERKSKRIHKKSA